MNLCTDHGSSLQTDQILPHILYEQTLGVQTIAKLVGEWLLGKGHAAEKGHSGREAVEYMCPTFPCVSLTPTASHRDFRQSSLIFHHSQVALWKMSVVKGWSDVFWLTAEIIGWTRSALFHIFDENECIDHPGIVTAWLSPFTVPGWKPLLSPRSIQPHPSAALQNCFEVRHPHNDNTQPKDEKSGSSCHSLEGFEEDYPLW